jgi:hypothetical protein
MVLLKYLHFVTYEKPARDKEILKLTMIHENVISLKTFGTALVTYKL